MAARSTFIKLDRSIQNWRWYTNANTFRVFIHILLNANIAPGDFENIKVNRGEYVTSYENLAKSLKLTIQQIRTAISHLKLTGELTVTKHSKFQVISMVNYDLYQGNLTGKSTGNQQANNSQLTGNQQQLKNIRNKELNNIPPYSPPRDTVSDKKTGYKKYSGNLEFDLDDIAEKPDDDFEE